MGLTKARLLKHDFPVKVIQIRFYLGRHRLDEYSGGRRMKLPGPRRRPIDSKQLTTTQSQQPQKSPPPRIPQTLHSPPCPPPNLSIPNSTGNARRLHWKTPSTMIQSQDKSLRFQVTNCKLKHLPQSSQEDKKIAE